MDHENDEKRKKWDNELADQRNHSQLIQRAFSLVTKYYELKNNSRLTITIRPICYSSRMEEIYNSGGRFQRILDLGTISRHMFSSTPRPL
jgi:predicted transcriptional regulator